MKNKLQLIKTGAMVLTAVVFFFMVYSTFFKAKTSTDKPGLKNQETPSTQDSRAQSQNTAISDPKTVTQEVSVPDTGDTVWVSFKYDIKDVFSPSDAAKKDLEKKAENTKNIPVSQQTVPLSEPEQESIRQALQFKGSIISQHQSVAIINGEFFHVGDRVNGYTVRSISEKKVDIDTGRGLLSLELVTHE